MFPKIKGLSENEVLINIKKYGPNILPEKKPPTDIEIFASQLRNPLIFVLISAAGLSVYLRDYADALVIGLAVTINTFLGFFQERQAKKEIRSLKKLVTFYAEVVRDGRRRKIEVSNITIGDSVILSQGSRVPADGKLVSTNRLFIDEAILTGESVPLEKKDGYEVFMGTHVLAGQGLMQVTKIGAATEIGKIATELVETKHSTPLEIQLKKFSRQILVMVLGLTMFVVLLGVFFGENIFDIFKTAVALAVSSIPEGLIVALTVVLAIGMRRMARKKGLVKNLNSAETLGGVSVICLDKTGTLTLGQMNVTDYYGPEKELAMQLTNANDMDDPIVIAGFEWAKKRYKAEVGTGERIDSIPFSSANRYFVSLNTYSPRSNIMYVNGAPDLLLEKSRIGIKQRKDIAKFILEKSSEGKRLIGLARKVVPITYKRIEDKDLIKELDWVGILALTDPLRESVKPSLEKAREAGIRLIVITGDYPGTAVSVMRSLGIEPKADEVITGKDLQKIDIRSQVFKKVKLFARTTPEQKLKIVTALQTSGEVVAMMGDGVNDAPALNKADIGVVVGDATDVAKESSDLILVDSNFETMIAAIEEGRGIFDNIRKIILYLLSDAFQEIVAVIGALILRIPIPITASQILWINVVSDGFPSTALSVDPKRNSIMQDFPRKHTETLVTSWMRTVIVIISFLGGITSLLLFVYFLNKTGDQVFARSVAFASMGTNSLIYVFSVRNLMHPFWQENPFRNKWLNIAVIAGAVLQFIPFATPATRSFWQTSSLSIEVWLMVIGMSLVMFLLVEALKMIFKTKFDNLLTNGKRLAF